MATTGLPAEAKPGYYDTSGASKSKAAYDRVAGNIDAPKIPTGAKQAYKKGVVGTGEILTSATMGAPTSVSGRAISKPTLGAADKAATTAVKISFFIL